MKVRSRVQKTIMDINDVVQILTWYQRTSSSSVLPTAPIFKWYGDTQPTKGMVANDYWYNTTDDSLYVYSGGSWSKDTSAVLLWTLTEPSYSSQTTSYLYTVQQSLFGDESCIWGEVVLSSSYEAAKAAYNAVNGANDETQTIYIQAVSGTNTMAGTTTWVTETGESTSGDAPGLTPKWTTKRPTYRSNYPVLFVATQRKSVGGVVTCTTPLKDDTTTVIDGGHITTGTIDASQVNVTNIDADNIASGTIDASVITVENIDADNITSGTIDASQVTVENIDADNITSGTIDASVVTVENIDADNIVTGTLSANMISGGTLSLGGTNNQHGVEVVYDSSSTEIGRWDRNGITIPVYRSVSSALPSGSNIAHVENIRMSDNGFWIDILPFSLDDGEGHIIWNETDTGVFGFFSKNYDPMFTHKFPWYTVDHLRMEKEEVVNNDSIPYGAVMTADQIAMYKFGNKPVDPDPFDDDEYHLAFDLSLTHCDYYVPVNIEKDLSTADINVNGDISCTGTINESAIPEDEFLTRTVTQQDNISISANGGSNIGFTAPSSTYTTNNIKYKLVSTTPLNVDVFPATTDGTGTTYVIATQTRPGGCYLRNVGTNTAKVRVDCYYLYKKMRNQS